MVHVTFADPDIVQSKLGTYGSGESGRRGSKLIPGQETDSLANRPPWLPPGAVDPSHHIPGLGGGEPVEGNTP